MGLFRIKKVNKEEVVQADEREQLLNRMQEQTRMLDQLQSDQHDFMQGLAKEQSKNAVKHISDFEELRRRRNVSKTSEDFQPQLDSSNSALEDFERKFKRDSSYDERIKQGERERALEEREKLEELKAMYAQGMFGPNNNNESIEDVPSRKM